MSRKVSRLIKKIQKADNIGINERKIVRFIIGNDSYPNGKNNSDSACNSGNKPENISSDDINGYKDFDKKEVAFLSETPNLDLVSIIGLLLWSIDDAVELINKITVQNKTTMKQFAIYLISKNIILINQNGNSKSLKKIFKHYKEKKICFKVMFVGKKGKRDYWSLIDKKISIPHCSPQTYGLKGENCYETYFSHRYSGCSGSNIPLSDFKL